jgi:serine/threonine protein kinase
MGEVYRARDTRLGRDVAVKVLPGMFASDPERLARFQREARTLAGLNHPNIAHLHGFEDEGSTPALVMELVEGEDLAERLRRGVVPLDEALAIARQIAQALEAAHERGIVHRDLKPANIKVREDGTVKVLDFGLAKAWEGSAKTSDGSSAPGTLMNSPTITTPAMTIQGVVLGTAAYMAPEQAKGKAVDKRADIWAFGAVLYEMVTGRRAFAGDDVSDTLASVLRAEVDWSGVPPSLVRLLKKCLEKDPKRRLHDIADAWDLIEGPATHATRPPRLGARLGWALAAFLFVTTSSLALIHFRETPPSGEVVRFQIQPPPKSTFDIYLALSPDGRQLAFTTRDGEGGVHLWVRDLDTLEARQLAGTQGAASPFWSPDSRNLGFSVDRILKRIDVSGGPAQTVAESSATVGTGTWNDDGVIVYGTRGVGPMYRVAAAGGAPTQLTVINTKVESLHAFPVFLPDGRHFLYYKNSTDRAAQGIYVGSIDVAPEQQSSTRLVASTMGNTALVRRGAGHDVLFYRDGTVFAQPFDVTRRQTVGDAVPIAEGVGSAGSFAFFTADRNGTLVYRTGSSAFATTGQLTWLDRQGATQATVGEPRPYSNVAGNLEIAPDSSKAAVAVVVTPVPDLWVVEFARGIGTRLTYHSSPDVGPVWSPDSRRVSFRSSRDGSFDVYVKDVDATSDETPLFQAATNDATLDWSADGRFMLLSRIAANTGVDLWVLPLGGREPVPLLETQFSESSARLSRDGRWVAYVSNESGREEIYLRPFVMSSDGKPTLGAKWQVSNDGGNWPRWRADGKELFYRHPTGAMMAVDVVAAATTVRTNLPRRLFPLPSTVALWDVTRDGQRFLVALPIGATGAEPVTVVLNWPVARR